MANVSIQKNSKLVERIPYIVGVVLCAISLGLAWWVTGPAPKPADDGFPADPPPLILPSKTPTRSLIARSAAFLATGQLKKAEKGFVVAVAEQSDSVEAQAGLILARWRSTGPRSVERDLTQLAAEYPDSAFAAMHLGMVRLLTGDRLQAQEALQEARRLGWRADDADGLRLSRLSDDLLHEHSFKGYLPVLVRVNEVKLEYRGVLSKVLKAVERDDRPEAARLAKPLLKADDGFAHIAAVVATFRKDDPEQTATKLASMMKDKQVHKDVRDRATLLAGLSLLWGGVSDKAAGCKLISSAASATASSSTSSFARPIAKELCA